MNRVTVIKGGDQHIDRAYLVIEGKICLKGTTNSIGLLRDELIADTTGKKAEVIHRYCSVENDINKAGVSLLD